MPESLLIIEDERLLGAELCGELASSGWDAVQAFDLAEAERFLFERNLEPLVVLSDMNLPDGNALDLLEKVRGRGVGGEWIFLTAYGGIPESVRALKLGAFDFLEKPCELERLQIVVAGAKRSALAQRRLRDEERMRGSRYSPQAFIGHSQAAREVRDMLERLSKVPFSGLVITGETGTGKGLMARILHNAGPRASAPLIEVNCAALPRDLMEAELFGHEAGAFTGAKGRRRGLIEQANGGTLFLDELGELELDLQAKLLKAIEDHRIRRVGGERELEIDLQVIAATNQALEQRVAEGAFRADLYHRLAVFRLEAPALRDRKEDLEDLLPVLIQEFNARSGHRVETVPPVVWSRLSAYHWPGNVRELRNLVERCVLLADGPVFPERWLHLGEAASATEAPLWGVVDEDRICLPLDGSVSLDGMECAILTEVLRRNSENVSLSARVLGTTREKLRYRVQKYGLKVSD
ncbi:sigma-54-dependent Fis family transcriptional regulator [Thiorhodococcus mannitoliphagus]|uniref:Sigma-54-dependent Fis family transcriptional regulator n=1 Tax=Thiorhodococcus mannitoliphagus TaxID=329406 RepID=A0A6P1E043_9GAMM|nr:sigma-54 dependent transcriptional regulator [Thiorhodococcus mannitoliphagus]NEX22653.1 sigma-54-dependent Fis family transcriptional regulator [Thiorhodococcus mannitoliphagus]